ncbi:hypothetical protein [Flavobacterium sp. FlaQc-47]|uniref:hypothetical protein n=1 Tax=Flavobacterium sp. FlaQc-47 TaxID=3374180 RepID=UPI0037581428
MSANFYGMKNIRRTFTLGFKILAASMSIHRGRSTKKYPVGIKLFKVNLFIELLN